MPIAGENKLQRPVASESVQNSVLKNGVVNVTTRALKRRRMCNIGNQDIIAIIIVIVNLPNHG